MRTLHVAALPFPSPQGTQGLLHTCLEALAEHGHEAHLLCYGYGAATLEARYTRHRAPGPAIGRSLRSGPSLAKLGLDLALARRLSALEAELRPDAVVAHHVEAAACALVAARAPVLFVAHTSLREELPSYFPAAAAGPLRRLGAGVDRLLIRSATRSCAVSPLLAELLSAASAHVVDVLPLPWRTPASAGGSEDRSRARAALGLAAHAEVALYAGNLDGYQGIDALLPAFVRLVERRPRFRWLVATESAPHALRAELRRLRLLEHACFARLDSEQARQRAHAAADLALVPRRAAGGLPIKLLDAWARGVPVVAARLALAGQPFTEGCTLVEEGSPEAWAAAITGLLDAPEAARKQAHHAQAYVAREHAPERFVMALERLVRSMVR